MKNLKKVYFFIVAIVFTTSLAFANYEELKVIKKGGRAHLFDNRVTYRTVTDTPATGDTPRKLYCRGKGPNSCVLHSAPDALPDIIIIVDEAVLNGTFSGTGTLGDYNYSWKDGSIPSDCDECPEYELDIVDK